MTRTLDLAPADLAILRQILRDHLPLGTAVWAFGSRATGSARRYSDLDLALQSEIPLDWHILTRLRDALSDSDLTIKVDVVDLLTLDEAFRHAIEPTMVSFPPF